LIFIKSDGPFKIADALRRSNLSTKPVDEPPRFDATRTPWPTAPPFPFALPPLRPPRRASMVTPGIGGGTTPTGRPCSSDG